MYPSQQPMRLYSSIWDADEWATRGGQDKINWDSAPFLSSYKTLNADACEWKDPYPACASTTWKHWWDQPRAWKLSLSERKMFRWVNSNYLEYNYCTDYKRYPTPPSECSVAPW
ncbi:hypothetical protein O6H91_08G005200 [Diphasiastrum complanatum]|nr:hypothetical protein O6H91_08G005200 [Diphasiastrum complanatum]